MNWIILKVSDEEKKTSLSITGAKKDHIINILKKKEGDLLKLILPGSGKFTFQIETITGSEIKGKIISQETEKQIHKFECTKVFFALPRPQTGKKIFHLCGVYGMGEICFIHPKSQNKEFWTSPLYNGGEWEEIESGLSQSGNIFPTAFSYHKQENWKEYLGPSENVFIFDGTGVPFENHREEIVTKALSRQKLNFCFGPESGWPQKDLDEFKFKNYRLVSLGSLVLRTEFAFHAFLHQTRTWLETDSA